MDHNKSFFAHNSHRTILIESSSINTGTDAFCSFSCRGPFLGTTEALWSLPETHLWQVKLVVNCADIARPRSQNIDRIICSRNQCTCVCPSSRLYLRRRKRLMVSEEKWMLQGMPLKDRIPMLEEMPVRFPHVALV